MKIVIAGGSGFLGSALTKFYNIKGHNVVVLTRGKAHQHDNVRWVRWDGVNEGDWVEELRDADVLINLAGKNVSCRYNEENKNEILRSRVDSVRVLSKGLSRWSRRVPLWIQASSATIYRHAEDRPMTEADGEVGDGFSVEVCRAWEAAFEDVREADRKIVMRTSIVLGEDDGAFPRLVRLSRFGLGGKMGDGNQYVSWLHINDFTRMIIWFIQNENACGTYNCTAPRPLTNRELMTRIARKTSPLLRLPGPVWILRLGAILIGTETELVLKSRWVLPRRLEQEGFTFGHPNIEDALESLIKV